MAIWYPDIKIAAGNNNAAGLVAIESITPSSDRPFYAPQSYGSYSPGEARVRADGTVTFSGFAAVEWRFSVLTLRQFAYLQDTYCAGGWSGLVTIRTRTDDPATYANYNAVMVLPTFDDVNRQFKAFRDVTVRFNRLVAL